MDIRHSMRDRVLRLGRYLRDVSPESWTVLAICVLFVVPLLTTRYFPGLDLPWHVAAIAVVHQHSDANVAREYLGYFEVHNRFTSYLSLYYGADLIAFIVRDVVIAVQCVIGLYVVTFVTSVRRLLRSFDGNGLLCVLAAPAAYNVIVEFGFVAYALAYPMTFYLWALARESMRAAVVRRTVLLIAVSLLLAITHPFAAAIAYSGALIVGLCFVDRSAIRGVIAVVASVAVGAGATMYSLFAMHRDAADSIPGIVQRASLWDKITNQAFTPIAESVTNVPAWLLGFNTPFWQATLLVLIACAALYAAVTCGRTPRAAGPFWRRYPTEVLLVVMIAGYLVTPMSFHWPRYWFGAQPRFLPLLLVCLLLWFRVKPAPMSWRSIPIVATSVCAGAMICASFLPFAREAEDFRAVTSASLPRARTLGFIEDDKPARRRADGPWRHFTHYVMVEHGGLTSNLPLTYQGRIGSGVLIPVKLAHESRRPALPKAPSLFEGIRSFDWDRHSLGWDQFLIRDSDPKQPFDYFREHSVHVRLVRRVGRWRLYVRQPVVPRTESKN